MWIFHYYTFTIHNFSFIQYYRKKHRIITSLHKKSSNMTIQRVIYNTFFKRTSTFLLTIVAGAFIFERTLDIGTDALFDSYNRGKQWKDIKHKYEN